MILYITKPKFIEQIENNLTNRIPIMSDEEYADLVAWKDSKIYSDYIRKNIRESIYKRLDMIGFADSAISIYDSLANWDEEEKRLEARGYGTFKWKKNPYNIIQSVLLLLSNLYADLYEGDIKPSFNIVGNKPDDIDNRNAQQLSKIIEKEFGTLTSFVNGTLKKHLKKTYDNDIDKFIKSFNKLGSISEVLSYTRYDFRTWITNKIMSGDVISILNEINNLYTFYYKNIDTIEDIRRSGIYIGHATLLINLISGRFTKILAIIGGEAIVGETIGEIFNSIIEKIESFFENGFIEELMNIFFSTTVYGSNSLKSLSLFKLIKESYFDKDTWDSLISEVTNNEGVAYSLTSKMAVAFGGIEDVNGLIDSLSDGDGEAINAKFTLISTYTIMYILLAIIRKQTMPIGSSYWDGYVTANRSESVSLPSIFEVRFGKNVHSISIENIDRSIMIETDPIVELSKTSTPQDYIKALNIFLDLSKVMGTLGQSNNYVDELSERDEIEKQREQLRKDVESYSKPKSEDDFRRERIFDAIRNNPVTEKEPQEKKIRFLKVKNYINGIIDDVIVYNQNKGKVVSYLHKKLGKETVDAMTPEQQIKNYNDLVGKEYKFKIDKIKAKGSKLVFLFKHSKWIIYLSIAGMLVGGGLIAYYKYFYKEDEQNSEDQINFNNELTPLLNKAENDLANGRLIRFEEDLVDFQGLRSLIDSWNELTLKYSNIKDFNEIFSTKFFGNIKYCYQYNILNANKYPYFVNTGNLGVDLSDAIISTKEQFSFANNDILFYQVDEGQKDAFVVNYDGNLIAKYKQLYETAIGVQEYAHEDGMLERIIYMYMLDKINNSEYCRLKIVKSIIDEYNTKYLTGYEMETWSRTEITESIKSIKVNGISSEITVDYVRFLKNLALFILSTYECRIEPFNFVTDNTEKQPNYNQGGKLELDIMLLPCEMLLKKILNKINTKICISSSKFFNKKNIMNTYKNNLIILDNGFLDVLMIQDYYHKINADKYLEYRVSVDEKHNDATFSDIVANRINIIISNNYIFDMLFAYEIDDLFNSKYGTMQDFINWLKRSIAIKLWDWFGALDADNEKNVLYYGGFGGSIQRRKAYRNYVKDYVDVNNFIKWADTVMHNNITIERGKINARILL